MSLDPRVEQLLKIITDILEPLHIPYAIGGAVAMVPYGISRYTSDLDVFAKDKDRPVIIGSLIKAGLRISAVNEPFHYAAYLPGIIDPDIRIDLLFPASEPEISAIEYPQRASFDNIEANIFPLELLIIAKFYANRTKDEIDLLAMYQRGIFDVDKVRSILESFDQESLDDFDRMIEKLKAPRKQRKRPKR